MSKYPRLYSCACLAGPLVDANLSHEDADPLYALLHSDLNQFLHFASFVPDWRSLSLLELLVAIVTHNSDELRDRAAVLQWEQRKAAYDADCASWRAVKDDKLSDWRGKPMTRGQRHLIADTAAILAIEMPEGMDRGSAADWLDANQANVVLKLENHP